MQPGYLLRNRYRIEKALAAGGFGETYLAIDLDFPGQRQVVVKHLKTAAQDPDTLRIAARLFEAEAKALAEMGKDARIPTLYAYFEEQGQFYLVQEFILGRTLTAELAGVRLDELEMLQVVQEILLGLQVVHRANKIHRDLKPDNIIRRAADRQLVLIDFGAVKEIRQASLTTPNPSTAVSIGIGTEGYMPMEQAMGRPRPASDIYAVGAIGIQCLTGKYPSELFDEDNCVLRWQHLCRVSPDVARVLGKMVAGTPIDRYSDAMVASKVIEDLLAVRQPKAPVIPVSPSPAVHAAPRQLAPAQPVVPPVVQQSPVKPMIPISPGVARKPPAQPALTPVAQKPVGRKMFLKWLGFGGLGGSLALVLSQWGKNSSLGDSSTLPTADALTETGKALKLTVVQFTSVKLDNTGQIVDRPKGNAAVYTEDLGGGVGLTMVKIPAGKFIMGSPDSEQERISHESPQRQVTVPEFYLGQTLVTQAQWQAIMGSNPFSFKGNDKLPVDTVSWLDAVEFCDKLSAKVGRGYRLPTEAEWEYACRAGTTTPFAFGKTITPAVVNYDGNSPYGGAAKGEFRGKTTPVVSFPANGFGLYDMHGNLWEWCLDEYFDSYSGAPINGSARGDYNSMDADKKRLLRGGSWYHDALYCRSANRDYDAASHRNLGIGLRVVGGSSSTPSRQNF